MSSYTTQLRWIIEQKLDELKLPHEEQHWKNAYAAIGLADYPIFAEEHREELNNRIIRHYYTREIGAETAGRFAMFMREAMLLIMPYYNQLYETEIRYKELDPLTDRGLTIDYEGSGENEGNTQSNTSGSSNSQSVFSDTPQSEMIPDQIRNMQYATNVNLDESTQTGDSRARSDSNYDARSKTHETGYTRPLSELLKLYRDNLLNIDRMVVEDKEIRDCFMGVW